MTCHHVSKTSQNLPQEDFKKKLEGNFLFLEVFISSKNRAAERKREEMK